MSLGEAIFKLLGRVLVGTAAPALALRTPALLSPPSLGLAGLVVSWPHWRRVRVRKTLKYRSRRKRIPQHSRRS